VAPEYIRRLHTQHPPAFDISKVDTLNNEQLTNLIRTTASSIQNMAIGYNRRLCDLVSQVSKNLFFYLNPPS
jgi:hypothetical protein